MTGNNSDCGCCAGVEVAVPMAETNPPGLSAISYRVGTYPTFYETMIARLSSISFEVPSSSGNGTDVVRPLQKLTTRDPADPSVALLDAWAVVGDVLSFYQERIANEGFLDTATERRSLIELGRLVGYRMRPGISASVKLAFTTATGFYGEIPAGTRAQSIPNAGENPQFFETSVPLTARDLWNALPPLKARPQLITPPASSADLPAPTDAQVIRTLYLDGITTNLKPQDRLFLSFGLDKMQQTLRVVQDVVPQPADGRTLVALAPNDYFYFSAPPIDLWSLQLKTQFPGSTLASQVAVILKRLNNNIKSLPHSYTFALIQGAIPAITQQRDIAETRGFSRLNAWLTGLLQAMRAGNFAGETSGNNSPGPNPKIEFQVSTLAASPLANLTKASTDLALPPSVQPANPYRLVRTVARTFAPQSDLAPRMIGALRPAASAGLYSAWSTVETPPARLRILAPRVKAGLFASAYPGSVVVAGGTATYTPLKPKDVYEKGTVPLATDELPLDGLNEQIKAGSWIAIETKGRNPTFHNVVATRTQTCNTQTGYSAKVTVLEITPAWYSALSDADKGAAAVLQQTIVYAQTDELTRVDEPLDADVSGDTIEIDGVLDGLEPGRWIIVSGNRTDVTNVAAVPASELAMIAGVVQGTSAPLPKAFPDSDPLFETVFYTTDANEAGDRLVVGRLLPELRKKIGGRATDPVVLDDWELPDFTNQQYGAQIELGPDALGEPVFATLYVPTSDEKAGIFPDFEGMLIDPDSGIPFVHGRIDKEQLLKGVFAWRIANPKLSTSLSLASPLAYSYDRNNVTIYGNVVDATQGQTTGEVLGDGDATVAFATFGLHQAPLTYTPAPTPSGVASSLQVRVNELLWKEVPDLYSAGPGERAYITMEDDAGATRIIFGDGAHGARLPTGTANLKATYRYGMGKSGNVAPGQISQLSFQPLGLKGVVNPLGASGGADADRPDQMRANAPIATMALDRLVSVRDYADFARNFAGIGKASATMITDGARNVVHVTVAGADDIPIDLTDALASNLRVAFSVNGDPFQDVVLGIRRLRLIVIVATIGVDPIYLWEDVARAVRAALNAAFGFMARNLGQPAFASEAIQIMQSVPGVSYVNLTHFDSVAENISAGAIAKLSKTLAPNEAIGASLARIDPAAAPGSAGRILPAELAILRPDLTDTILLTQAAS